ncbi:hypothetical protein B7494_g1654 [Chlorociboria aeruginascens]|nr:hypothetical protein B7494_g1654 [Chlorociboria aeruginascens]
MSADKISSILERNAKYAQTHTAPKPLSQGILKAKAMGKKATVIKAAIIRNAGGRTSDALRSLVALDTVGHLGTVVVIHHTDCGMSHTSAAAFDESAKTNHPDIDLKGESLGAIADPDKTIIEDVEFLKSYPSLSQNVNIVGFVLDTATGVVKKADV